jgi:lipid A ethanolaminephosphotransferase
MQMRRPTITGLWLTTLTAAYVLFLTNATFWSKAADYFSANPFRFASFIAILLLAHIAILALFSARQIVKPFMIIFILIAAASSYFADNFGTVIDREMIANAVETTSAEAGHLLTPAFFAHMALYGLVPSLLILWLRLKPVRLGAAAKRAAATIAVCLTLLVTLTAFQQSFFVPMWRMEKNGFMAYLVPSNPINSAINFAIRQFNGAEIVAQPYGVDAKVGQVLAKADKKVLTVIVVGETARAQNFSLLGYARDTNPELAARDVIAFSNVSSCGTATAVSLPCMFSHLGRAGYSHNKALASENLVDVIHHAGLKIEWWENNTSSKHVSDRIPQRSYYTANDARFCQPGGGDCNDDILVDALGRDIDALMANGNAVLVLHSGGSHGPAYYLRYPRDRAKFKPDCQTPQISNCSDEELLNAYDNSILETDHMLAGVIDVLKSRQDSIASSMIYVSDHGESLGENGLYLHGAPYIVAPAEQTHIPMIAWFSGGFAQVTGLDTDCVRAKEGETLSHDNLFDTVLGLMDIQTSVYRPELDAFASCRTIHGS